MKKKVLVTGAAGFIGSHLSKRLEQEGHDVRLVDDFSRGRREYLEYLKIKSPCIRMDLREYTMYSRGYFEGVDEVYHCASRIGGNQFLHGSVKNELRALQDNLAIDRNVFKMCFEEEVKKIIYTSSVSVYNTQRQNLPNAIFSENDIVTQKIDPEGGYGWAKFIGEKQLEMMKNNGTKVGITRIFKSYGPCDDYTPWSGQVVCSLMRKIIKDEDFVVWGDGTTERCLVYIDDLIDGIIKISKSVEDESDVFNLGGNRPITVKKLAERIIKISGKDINIKYDTTKPSGVRSRIPVLTRAREKLDWMPTTELEEGLKKTYKWMEHDLSE